MTDVYKLFEARIRIVDRDGKLTVAGQKSFRHVVKLFGGSGNQLPNSFVYVPPGGAALAFVYTDSSGSVTTTASPVNGQILIGSTGSTPVVATITGTSNRIIVTNGTGTITLSAPQDIHTGASPAFVGISLAGLTANAFLYPAAGGVLTATAAATNGQLLIGRTSSAPLAATLTGTANQVTITNGAGTITLALPQDVHSGASPTFTGLSLSALTANSFLYSGTSSALTSTTAPTNGQLLIGSTGSAPTKAALTGTANQVNVANGAGTITLSLPQDIHTGASPTFANLLSGTYTPTLTNVANLDASTAYQCQYMRVGSVVTVSGRVDVDPTTTATLTQLGISLPISSNLGAAEDCAGTAASSLVASESSAILADLANNRAQMQWITGDTTNHAMYFTFTYEII